MIDGFIVDIQERWDRRAARELREAVASRVSRQYLASAVFTINGTIELDMPSLSDAREIFEQLASLPTALCLAEDRIAWNSDGLSYELLLRGQSLIQVGPLSEPENTDSSRE